MHKSMENRLINGVIVGDPIGRYEAGRKFRPIETIEFTDQLISDRWTIRIPKFLADYHGWWDAWEKERHLSMAANLKPQMTFYEVGASDGWQAALYAKIAPTEKIVLIEPAADVWPNIKLILEQNGLAIPKATYVGFAADYDAGVAEINLDSWPNLDYSNFLKGQSFALLHSKEGSSLPRRKLDTIVERAGKPDAINIDVEGSELAVLQGAEETLRKWHPLIWLSIHQGVGPAPAVVYQFMRSCGYNGDFLAVDHEEHHFFTANSN